MDVARYRKFYVAFGTAVTTAVSFLADGELSLNDGIGIALAFLGALGVYKVRNEP